MIESPIKFCFAIHRKAILLAQTIMADNRTAHAKPNARPGLKLKNIDEKQMHNLFLKNMSGLIEESKNPSNGENP